MDLALSEIRSFSEGFLLGGRRIGIISVSVQPLV
jgi:hypothetical protein